MADLTWKVKKGINSQNKGLSLLLDISTKLLCRMLIITSKGGLTLNELSEEAQRVLRLIKLFKITLI